MPGILGGVKFQASIPSVAKSVHDKLWLFSETTKSNRELFTYWQSSNIFFLYNQVIQWSRLECQNSAVCPTTLHHCWTTARYGIIQICYKKICSQAWPLAGTKWSCLWLQTVFICYINLVTYHKIFHLYAKP